MNFLVSAVSITVRTRWQEHINIARSMFHSSWLSRSEKNLSNILNQQNIVHRLCRSTGNAANGKKRCKVERLEGFVPLYLNKHSFQMFRWVQLFLVEGKWSYLHAYLPCGSDDGVLAGADSRCNNSEGDVLLLQYVRNNRRGNLLCVLFLSRTSERLPYISQHTQ